MQAQACPSCGGEESLIDPAQRICCVACMTVLGNVPAPALVGLARQWTCTGMNCRHLNDQRSLFCAVCLASQDPLSPSKHQCATVLMLTRRHWLNNHRTKSLHDMMTKHGTLFGSTDQARWSEMTVWNHWNDTCFGIARRTIAGRQCTAEETVELLIGWLQLWSHAQGRNAIARNWLEKYRIQVDNNTIGAVKEYLKLLTAAWIGHRKQQRSSLQAAAAQLVERLSEEQRLLYKVNHANMRWQYLDTYGDLDDAAVQQLKDRNVLLSARVRNRAYEENQRIVAARIDGAAAAADVVRQEFVAEGERAPALEARLDDVIPLANAPVRAAPADDGAAPAAAQGALPPDNIIDDMDE